MLMACPDPSVRLVQAYLAVAVATTVVTVTVVTVVVKTVVDPGFFTVIAGTGKFLEQKDKAGG